MALATVRLHDLATSTFKTVRPVTLAVEDTTTPTEPEAGGSTATSVTTRNITFHFDTTYPTGRYVNGEWWVKPNTAGGSVVVTHTDPPLLYDPLKPGDKSVCLNGMMIDPPGGTTQGWSHRLTGYDPSLNLADASQTFTPGSKPISLIKSQTADGDWNADTSNHKPKLQDAACLTILPYSHAAGPDHFRPPYMAGAKTQFTTSDVREDLLPSLAPPAGGVSPTLEQVRWKFAALMLDHGGSWTTRYVHPWRAFTSYDGTSHHNYGSNVGKDWCDAMLRLMLNDPIADKRAALYGVLQCAIDTAGVADSSSSFHADGGHNVGRKAMVTFGAVILDSTWMKDIAGRASDGEFSENRHVYRSSAPVMNGMALFGKPGSSGEYEKVRLGGSGSRDLRDPYEVVDGGEVAGSTYLVCCTFRIYKASALIAMLLPGGRAVWNRHKDYSGFFEWVDRFVHIGTWVVDKDNAGVPYGRTWYTSGAWRPDVDLHKKNADHGHYGTGFQSDMWNLYRSAAKDDRAPFPDYKQRTQHLPAG